MNDDRMSRLHLTGVKAVNPKCEVACKPSVTLDDIMHFRQFNSHCPGHPEYRWTSGVETMKVLVCNARSSSLKFGLFEAEDEMLLAESGIGWTIKPAAPVFRQNGHCPRKEH